jgi:cytochrome P450
MKDAMQRNVHQLLDAAVQRGQCDIVQDIATPYACQNILDFYGIPQSDRELLTPWIADYRGLVAGTIGTTVSIPQQLLEALFSVGNLMTYLRRLMQQRCRIPQDDFFQSLITAGNHYEVLQEEDRIINYALLLIVGQDTITHTISTGVLTLLQHAEQLQQCQDDPSLFAQACNEILRYDGPIRLLVRFPTEDVVVGGKHIKAGQQVTLLLSAANHDLTMFSEPHRFNIHRSDPWMFGNSFCTHAS